MANLSTESLMKISTHGSFAVETEMHVQNEDNEETIETSWSTDHETLDRDISNKDQDENDNNEICCGSSERECVYASVFCDTCRTAYGCICKWCTKCGLPQPLCECNWCHNCKGKKDECYCERCYHCEQLRYNGCNCSNCAFCYRHLSECCCGDCNLCDRAVADCRCADPRTPRMKLESGSKVFSCLNIPTPHDCTVWNNKNKVIVESDYTHIIAFQNPIPKWKQSAKQRLQKSRCTVEYRVKQLGRKIREIVAVRLEPEVESTHINVRTKSGIRRMVTQLASLPTDQPNISFDMECHNLGPEERPCILAIRDETVPQNYLVDLRTLNTKAWTTKNSAGITLRNIFEDAKIPKLIFAVAQDAVALFAGHGIRLAGVIDLQYMCLLNRSGFPEWKIGLSKAITDHAALTAEELAEFLKKKNRERGTFWRYKSVRPLLQCDKDYAVNDLKYLKRIYFNTQPSLDDEEIQAVHEFTQKEIDNACNWPKGWIRQGARVREDFGFWWQRKHWDDDDY